MKQLLTSLAAGFTALATLALPSLAAAQSSASPYTSATRYDELGRVVGTIAPDPDGIGTGTLKHAATRTFYDNRGNVTKVETGELSAWKNEDQDPHSWTGFTIHTRVETTYDAANRKLTDKVSGITGGTATPIGLTQYSYDNVGRLECTAVRMNPAAYGSLPSSACTHTIAGTDGPDRITRTMYDAAGQVSQIRKAVGTGIEIADVTYTYTGNGQIKNVIDANGNKAELRYDSYDRQTRWVFPSKTAPTGFNDSSPSAAVSTAGALNETDYESYSYDANGNRLGLRKRDGFVINYAYDNLNRMTFKNLPYRADLSSTHRRDVYYTYDLRGMQTRARFLSTNGVGVSYVYDGFGRLKSETQNTDGTTRAVTSLYDANSNRTRVTHPDGYKWNFDYDGLNRLTNLYQDTYLMGTATYNSRGLPQRLAWSTGVNFRDFDYDDAGRLDQIFINLNGTSKDVTWDYSRNAASQIKTETQSNDSYSWDAHITVDRGYATNGLNQYTSAGSAAFCYDANGNLTADGSHVYKYDLENRLVERRVQTNSNCAALSYSGTLKASLKYDPTGRLYELSGGAAGMQRFVYDGNALVMEYNGSNVVQRRYVHGSNVDADDPLVWYEGSAGTGTGRRFVHADPRGSIVAVTDYLGNSIATNTYDEYGIPDDASGNDISTKGRFRYTGQAWIPELEMYYYKARIYSPTLGRFMQTDPIGYEDQFNLYAYVGNDPINGVDPSGLAGCSASMGTKLCVQAQRSQKKVENDLVAARADIANLQTERAEIESGDRSELSARAQGTEEGLNQAFGSSTNEVAAAVDGYFAKAQDFIRDPGSAKGGKYDFRGPNNQELTAGYNQAYAGWVDRQNLNEVVLSLANFPRVGELGRRITVLHEAMHAVGVLPGYLGEIYNGIPQFSQQKGGTAYSVYHNAHSYSCFVYATSC